VPQVPIDFSDYHRTVIAYHGTTVETAERLVAGEDFQPSDQDDEWFGKGIYFWEHAFQQAWRWAKKKDKMNPAVVGAVLRLGNCFDLLDTGNVAVLRDFHEKYVAKIQVAGLGLAVNVWNRKSLDCAVFNRLAAN